MKKKSPAPPGSDTAAARRRLAELRGALLSLHKALVDSERLSYEKTLGQVASPNHFLQLLISDPWFAWLHPLSQLIVSIDESLADGEPLTAVAADALARQSALLLAPSEDGQEFSGHYYEALQRDPDVVLAHADVVKKICPKRKS